MDMIVVEGAEETETHEGTMARIVTIDDIDDVDALHAEVLEATWVDDDETSRAEALDLVHIDEDEEERSYQRDMTDARMALRRDRIRQRQVFARSPRRVTRRARERRTGAAVRVTTRQAVAGDAPPAGDPPGRTSLGGRS
jgi:esterase/lipase superfamily enzyme